MTSEKTITKRNPRRNLPVGQSPRERGRQKLVGVLCWLYQWHTTVSPLICELLGTTERTYLVELERKGYVKSFPAPSLICGRGFMLTSDGVNAAMTALGKQLPYTIHPGSVSHANLKHNLAIQRHAIKTHRKGFNVTPGRFLSAHQGGKIPDALIHVPHGILALEVELSPKWSAELEQALHGHLNALVHGDWQGVIYLSNSEVLLENYKQRLTFPIPDWWQSTMTDGSTRWMRGSDRVVSEELREKFSWEFNPGLLKDFERIF